jgi:hypothetical protein
MPPTILPCPSLITPRRPPSCSPRPPRHLRTTPAAGSDRTSSNSRGGRTASSSHSRDSRTGNSNSRDGRTDNNNSSSSSSSQGGKTHNNRNSRSGKIRSGRRQHRHPHPHHRRQRRRRSRLLRHRHRRRRQRVTARAHLRLVRRISKDNGSRTAGQTGSGTGPPRRLLLRRRLRLHRAPRRHRRQRVTARAHLPVARKTSNDNGSRTDGKSGGRTRSRASRIASATRANRMRPATGAIAL